MDSTFLRVAETMNSEIQQKLTFNLNSKLIFSLK